MGKFALPTPSPPLSSFVFVLLRKRLTKIRASNIATFKSTSRYLDDLLNIGNEYFEEIADTIYPEKLQLNKTNTSLRRARNTVCKGLDFISLFAQPGVLHVSEPSLYCLAYV